jgi:hypothetical protein
VTYASGVYNISGMLSIAAGVIITLDASKADGDDFIFNVSSYLAFGAGVKVQVENGNVNTRVIWNVDSGYVTTGEGAEIVGTVMAGSYVSVGATSSIKSPGCFAGGTAHSAAGYVSLGDSAIIGSNNAFVASCEAQAAAGNGSPGAVDHGNGISASFSHPVGVAVDGSGNVYVADTHNQLIRRILG